MRKRSSSATLLGKLKWGMGLEHSGHGSPLNSFVPILSCLAAYTLAQPKANMNILPIPNLSSPYPELGLRQAWFASPMASSTPTPKIEAQIQPPGPSVHPPWWR